MLKAAGASLVILSCTLLGVRQSMKLSKRKELLLEIQKMVLLLLGEISYRKEALPEAMERVAGKTAEPFRGFLEEVSGTACQYEGERFVDIFRNTAEKYLKDSDMSSRQQENFMQLGEYLGYLDIAMQKNSTALYLEELKQEIRQMEKEMPAKKKMYQSLGFLGGIFLTILFL